MNENRGPWYLLTGLVLGLLLSVAIAWLFRPPEFVDTKVAPSALRGDFKDQYRAMIALAYLADGDLVRAQARLDLLGDEDVYRVLAEQAQRAQAAGQSEAHALGMLASAINPDAGGAPSDLPVSSPTPFATIVYTPTLIIPGQP